MLPFVSQTDGQQTLGFRPVLVAEEEMNDF
jgi:hypothetical protein